MKKHFLLLLWMTLLPLAGWAQVRITVTLGTINKVYGEADPAVTGLDFSWTTDGGTSTTEVNAANLLAALDYRRVSAGDEVNSVKYYTMVANNNKPADWILVIANQGVINILPKSLGTGTTALEPGISIEDITGISYTGQEKTPNLAVHYDGTLVDEDLVKDRDYTVEFTNNVNKGTATATLTGIGNYEGSVVKEFTIAARSLANVTIADIPDQTFAWDDHNVAIAQTPGITVTDAELGTTLVAGTDYVMLSDAEYTDGYKDNYNAGTAASVQIVGLGNYDNTTTATKTFTINPMSIVDAEGNLINGFGLGKTTAAEGLVYTGAALTPGIVFRCHGTNSNVNANRTVTYDNNINATTAESKATLTWTGINNLTGSYTFKFDIAPRPVEDLTFDPSLEADETYKGSQITKTTEGMVTYGALPALVAGTDFDVEDGENLNVGDNAGSTEFTFKGNYTGTVTKNFNITAATLTVNAKNFTKSLGNADPTSDELATGKYYEITGFVGDEATTVTVTGAPTFAIAGHTEVAGPKTGVISISSVDGLSAPNYSFAIGATADLIISSAGVAIAATNATQTYGYKLPTLDKDAFAFTATGLLSGENITALTFTVKDAEGNEYAAGDMLEVGEYTITPSAASATSDSYEFSYTPATLTINPYKLTIEAQDQAIDYGKEPVVGTNASTHFANTRVKLLDVDGNLILKSAFEGLYGVWKGDFIESTEWVVADNHPLAEPGTIKVNLKADYDSKNFTVTTVDGNVTYTAVPTDLTLTRVSKADVATQEVSSTIEKYNKAKNIKVTIKYNDAAAYNTFKAEQWYTMVLPFNATVREISAAFGYAVVDVIDETNTDKNKMAFKLVMGDIPANTPFIVKVDKDIDMTKDDAVKFTERTIVNPADEAALTKKDAAGNMFIGSYTGIDGLGAAVPGAWWFSLSDGGIKPASDTGYLRQLSAYMILPGAKAPVFEIEEPDGMTTTIKAIDFAKENAAVSAEGWYTINGVKLVGAPTEKGVYIKDGKKVVIK